VDAFERNDDFPDAKPITAGTPFNLVLFAGVDTNDGTDNDFFTFDIAGDKTKLHLEITNDSPADEAQTHFVTVYDANKSQLGATSEPNARANLSEEFNVTSGEKVFLKFYDGASTNSATPSKVTVSFL